MSVHRAWVHLSYSETTVGIGINHSYHGEIGFATNSCVQQDYQLVAVLCALYVTPPNTRVQITASVGTLPCQVPGMDSDDSITKPHSRNIEMATICGQLIEERNIKAEYSIKPKTQDAAAHSSSRICARSAYQQITHDPKSGLMVMAIPSLGLNIRLIDPCSETVPRIARVFNMISVASTNAYNAPETTPVIPEVSVSLEIPETESAHVAVKPTTSQRQMAAEDCYFNVLLLCISCTSMILVNCDSLHPLIEQLPCKIECSGVLIPTTCRTCIEDIEENDSEEQDMSLSQRFESVSLSMQCFEESFFHKCAVMICKGSCPIASVNDRALYIDIDTINLNCNSTCYVRSLKLNKHDRTVKIESFLRMGFL